MSELDELTYLRLFRLCVTTGVACGLSSPDEWLSQFLSHYDCFFALDQNSATDDFPFFAVCNEFESRFREDFEE